MTIKSSIVESKEYRYPRYVTTDHPSLGSGMDRCTMERNEELGHVLRKTLGL